MKNRFFLISCFTVVSVLAFAAAADGTWNLQGSAVNAPQHLVLSVSGTTLSGTVDGVAITNGGVQGRVLWFRAVRSGVTYNYKGTVSGSQINMFEEPPSGRGRALTFVRGS